MGELIFVGIGLHDSFGISLRGLTEIRSAVTVFAELYTNLMPSLSFTKLEELSGKNIILLSRSDLEENNGETVFDATNNGKTILLIPGDPLIATTHVSLRIEAVKRGIKTRIVHGASILSAAIGLSGLHNYKFGKSVTIPLTTELHVETPYNVIALNQQIGLHTFCLLDIDVIENRFLNINKGLEYLLKIEAKKQQNVINLETLFVGISRAGSRNPVIVSGLIRDFLNYDFGGPPQCLIFPGPLHFMEADALIYLANAPEQIRSKAK